MDELLGARQVTEGGFSLVMMRFAVCRVDEDVDYIMKEGRVDGF